MVWRIYDKDCFHIRALTATTAKCKWKYHGTSPAATPTDGITNCAINNIINGRRARWTQKFQKRVGKSKPTLMKIAKSQRPDLFALECLYYWWCPIRHTWIWYATHEERLTQCQLSSSISFFKARFFSINKAFRFFPLEISPPLQLAAWTTLL